MNGLHCLTLLCALISLVLHLFALASDHWQYAYDAHSGLWQECIGTKCSMRGADVKGYLHTTRAFMVIGMFLGSLSYFLLCAMFFYTQSAYYCLAKNAASLSYAAGICSIIGMATYTASVTSDSYGWSFDVGWASFPLFFITEQQRCARWHTIAEMRLTECSLP
ncbi:lens fiber membrane intrinsic protein-like [Hemicordylus capensis]|uniref:lens fiber membrane intrinsic protein-like n=1 Tax=Hemicordylus capensis TaxID=884348 RepID=UPI002303FD76|nr:lens fiber membrane intrinsic protein-like [Hemicordylus capensis]